MDNKIMSDMITNHKSCYISKDSNGNITEIHLRPKQIEESLKDKLQPEDICKAGKIVERIGEYNQLKMSLCNGCIETNCSKRNNSLTALPNGNINAKVMFINKQPTEYESAYGLSFSDKNGLFISLILDKINVPRESVYFTDMIKCNNQLDEQSFNECINRYLMEEINIVNPSVIVCNSMSVFKTCISRGIFKGLPSDISYGNIYDAELFNGNHIKATAIYDLNTVLQKEGEDYIRCKNDLWSQILNAFKAL